MATRESPAKRSPSSQAPQNMIAGLISPPVESPGQESDNDSLPGQGYTSSHASSDDEQPAILLLDDSTSSSHANQRRQASHPSDSRSTDSEPSAEAPGKYCAIASCCALRTTTVCLNPRPLKPVSLFNARWCVAGTTTIVVAQLRRSRSLLEKAAQSAV